MMKAYSSRELIKKLKKDGWVYVGQEGSHKHFKHPAKSIKVTVPDHGKFLKKTTAAKIIKDAGLKI